MLTIFTLENPVLKTLAPTFPPAALVLADGRVFHGLAVGAAGLRAGRLAACTAMLGYQEALTDPASHEEILVYGYPHIGNTGSVHADSESDRIWAAGLVLRDLPLRHSNYRADSDLSNFLQAQQTPAMADLDTRALLRLLREEGSQAACIVAAAAGQSLQDSDLQAAQAAAQAYTPDPQASASVSCQQPYAWQQGLWSVAEEYTEVSSDAKAKLVAVYDLGVKRSTLRALVSRGLRVQVLPASTPWTEVSAMAPDAVIFAGGPSADRLAADVLSHAQAALASSLPCLGLGSGHLALAVASGCALQTNRRTRVDDNHSIRDLRDGRAHVLPLHYRHSIATEGLPAAVKLVQQSLFDDAAVGLSYREHASSFQGDISALDILDRFSNALA